VQGSLKDSELRKLRKGKAFESIEGKHREFVPWSV
jgi:hypothetical protein